MQHPVEREDPYRHLDFFLIEISTNKKVVMIDCRNPIFSSTFFQSSRILKINMYHIKGIKI